MTPPQNTLNSFRNNLLLLLVLLGWPLGAEIIPSSNRIDWATYTAARVLPKRTNSGSWSIYTNLTSSATASTINSAIHNCPTGQVVKLGAGTYTLGGQVKFDWDDDNKCLRGTTNASGVPTTVLIGSGGGGGGMIDFGGDSGESSTTISSGATRDSTNIVVASAMGIAVGNIICIAQTNEPGLAWCHACAISEKTMTETKLVTAINGTTITFWPPMFYTLGYNPVVLRWSDITVNSGLEDVAVHPAGGDSSVSMVYF
jgi:hypothetical protein